MDEEEEVKAALIPPGQQDYDRSQLPNLLRIYYTWLFPFDKYYEWLKYSDVDMFSHREFSFTLEDDVYVRYQSFDSMEALQEGLKKNLPFKIDIGAMFSVKPCMRNRVQQASFKALRKELVFDIDMTDYDDIRTCCKEAQICRQCWRFMTIAVQILDRALREDFGFRHLLWVYSGRRGIHCWVCDQEAIELSQAARTAVVEYLTLIKGGEQQAQKVHLNTPIHPSIRRALKVIDGHFVHLLREQDFLATPEQWNKVLAFLPPKLKSDLNEEWAEHPHWSSEDKWRRLKNEAKELALDAIKLQWAYPRLDVNVSKGINHLLKSPLCVHPKTGRVCVPIDAKKADMFDPFTVPTISQICAEFESRSKEHAQKLSYMKTSLKPYMETFTQQFLIPLKKENGRRKRNEPSLDF